MNTSATFYSPSLDTDQAFDQKPPKKSSKSWSSFVHNPRKFLAAIMGVAFISVLGIGLAAGMTAMNQSTEDRSSASYGLNNMQIYFEPDNKTLTSAGETIMIPVKLVAGHNIGAVTFGVAFDPNLVNDGMVSFIPNPAYTVDRAGYGENIDIPNTPNTSERIFMVYAKDADSTGVLGGSFGSLRIVTNPNFSGNSTVKFLYPCNIECAGMGQAFNTASFPGLGQVVVSQEPYAGMLFEAQPTNNLRVSRVAGGPTNTPVPGAPTPVPPMFSGVPNPGVLSYCTTTTANCTDAQWQIATVANGQSTVPANSKQLRYRIDNITNPVGWTTNMRAEVTGRNAVVQTGLGVTASNLTAVNWPVVVGTNYVKEENGNQFICTIRPMASGDYRYKKYVRRPIGSTAEGEPATADGRCANNTRITVTLAGAPTATPTNTPPAQNTPADLVPTFFEMPTSVSVNQSFPVNIRITNQGGTMTPNPVTVILYRNDIEIYRTTRTASVLANASYTVTRNEVAAAVGTLQYRVRVIMSGEVLTGNNIATRSVAVTAAGAPTATPTRTPTPTITPRPGAATATPTPAGVSQCNATNLKLRGIVYRETAKDSGQYVKVTNTPNIVNLRSITSGISYNYTVGTYSYGSYDFGGIKYGQYRLSGTPMAGYSTPVIDLTVCTAGSCDASGTICERDIRYRKL